MAKSKELSVKCLASMRCVFERLRANKTVCKVFRISVVCLLVLLAIVAYTLVVSRYASNKAVSQYKVQLEQLRAEEEAADPAVVLRKQKTEEYGKVIRGLKAYGYGFDDYVSLYWCVDARTRNPAYPDNVIDVIQQDGQWPGYSVSNEVSADDYNMADRVISAVESVEHPLVANTFVYASFDREGITLRDTFEITSQTHFWRYED